MMVEGRRTLCPRDIYAGYVGVRLCTRVPIKDYTQCMKGVLQRCYKGITGSKEGPYGLERESLTVCVCAPSLYVGVILCTRVGTKDLMGYTMRSIRLRLSINANANAPPSSMLVYYMGLGGGIKD